MAGVFISYRRDDSQGSTGRVADRLGQILGSDVPVFLDIDSIRPGQDFRAVIRDTLSRCDVTLVMIGPRWIDVADPLGTRRLDDPADLHRLEVESALRSSSTTIPVLLEGATMPSADELPDSIRPLASVHAAEVSIRRFSADVEFLAELVRTEVTRTPPAIGPPDESSDPGTAPTPDAAPNRTPLRRPILLAGALAALVLVIGAIVLVSGPDQARVDLSTKPTESIPAAVESETVETTGMATDVFDLEVGDCFGATETTLVTTVDVVDCADLHHNEVFAIWNSFSSTRPGDDLLLDGCVSRFDEVVGLEYSASIYWVAGFWSDEDRWASGERSVICYGLVRDGEGAAIATTGSMIGSGN
jgi:TIR domain/Septum formation